MKNVSSLWKIVYIAILLFSTCTYAQMPLARFSVNSTSGNSLTFNNESSGTPTSYSWNFPGGNPGTSTLSDPSVSYATSGTYTAVLTVTNESGSSTASRTFVISEGQTIINLSSGVNNDGTLMSTNSIPDNNWTYTHPDGSNSTPVTRLHCTSCGWASAQIPPDNAIQSVWITGNNTVTGYHYYESKSFVIPENVSDALLTLRSLSFVRNWTYLVKENIDGTETETLITQTTFMSDGAKGWLNSRSPLVEDMPVAPGTYHIKVKVYTNNTGQRQALDVNANVKYSSSFLISPAVNFSADILNTTTGSPIAFTNLSNGNPVSYLWKFKNGTTELSSTEMNPTLIFSEAGTYNVELTVDYGEGMTSFLEVENYINITNLDFTKAPNSYIFDPYQDEYDGLYIPVKKAYDMWSDVNGYLNEPITGESLTASILWEDVPGLIKSNPDTPNYYDLPVEGTDENAKIKVIVDKSKGEGNAVIAFKVNGEVKWSWHIWVTDTPDIGGVNSLLEPYNKNLDGDFFAPAFMDRNLGATSNHFLGNEWNKSGGLMYQWGRKDPFPPLAYKDYTFYDVEGEIGRVRHDNSYGNAANTLLDHTILRPYSNINDNIKYSVKNPFKYIYYNQNTQSWYSSVAANGSFMFDLWSDNYGGAVGGQYPSSSTYKPHQLKSPYDPCPKDWRIPSHNGRTTSGSVFSVWGRAGSGDDDSNGYNKITANTLNVMLDGVKVYPGLGFNFENVSGGNRNLGIYPLTGRFYKYSPSSQPKFQDVFSEGRFWTATAYNSNARIMALISDFARFDGGGEEIYGLNQFNHSNASTNTEMSQVAQGVRCIQDPNAHELENFSTEYIPADTQNRDYKNGLYNPNSYIVSNNQAFLEIPINKAFAIYNQYLSDREWPSGQLNTRVEWTTNTNLVINVSLINASLTDPDEGLIKVEFGSGNPKGNAVVSLLSDDEILWSWHIWAPEDDPTANPIIYTNEETLASLNIVNATKSGVAPLRTTFMDRNLGAVEAFPNVIDANNPTGDEKNKISKSGGFHYQWGRKDPIPSFKNVGNNAGDYVIYKETGKNSNGNSIFGETIDGSSYNSSYTSDYNTYGSNSSLKRNEKIQNNLKYSVNNPLFFLYHDGIGEPWNYGASNVQNQIKDWMGDERNLAENRWGHGDKKSPFDPCPEGWRVPDVSFTFFGAATINDGGSGSGPIGNSPWYYNKILSGSESEFKRHLKQDRAYDISSSNYDGTWVPGYGWVFNNVNYKTGNYPATGIRGFYGENQVSYQNNIAGVWTASLADLQLGYALALQLGTSNNQGTVTSGGGFYPQAGMNVRCSLDEPRYNGQQQDSSKVQQIIDNITEELTQTNKNNGGKEIVYPNPVENYLYINSKENIEFVLYDLDGKIISKSTFKNSHIDMSFLDKGIYIIKLFNSDRNTIKLQKIIKN